ncbi:MAG TPA: AgmX/PglI C-terminal domain-containing protein [Burkholderiaceae bacterium]|nr:AgmX/PglI C-terminal domain-containing protein [Burkholderiaceae bacterium]
MTAAAHYVSFRQAVLPWTVSEDDERRFKRIARRVLIIVALLFLLMPWIPLPKVDRTEVQELPPQFAKLLLESKPVPPPPPPKVEKLPGTEDKANPTKVPETAKPEPTKAPVPEARKPEPNKPPGEKLDNARQKASGVGLLALKDELAEIRGAPVAVQLKQDIKQGPGVGTGVGVGVGAGTDAGIPERALITSNATNGSGGINTAGYSRNTGGGGLAGRATTLVEGVAGGGGGGGAGGGGGGGGGAGKGGTLQRGHSGKASRSIEEIKLVFERNKGAIYAIYNRALREDPSLEGKVVLELKIAPSGQVVDLRILSSELKQVELEKKLVARIRQFDFGAKDVDLMVVTWPVDFLPS